MSIDGLQNLWIPPTLDGLNIVNADELYIDGNQVNINDLVPYTGATQTLNMGGENIQTSHLATSGNDVINKTKLDAEINYLATAISGTFLNKITATAQTVTGAITYSANQTYSTATINTVAVFDGTKQLSSSAVSTTELGYVSGVTSGVQTQLNGKLNLTGGSLTGALSMGANKVTSSSVPSVGDDLTIKRM